MLILRGIGIYLLVLLLDRGPLNALTVQSGRLALHSLQYV